MTQHEALADSQAVLASPDAADLPEFEGDEKGAIYVHSGDDAADEYPTFFEVPKELFDRVYAVRPDDTFVANLRTLLDA